MPPVTWYLRPTLFSEQPLVEALGCPPFLARLLTLRGITGPADEGYPEVVYDAMVVALSGRIFLDETVDLTPEAVLREIWEDQFILAPAAAAPG